MTYKRWAIQMTDSGALLTHFSGEPETYWTRREARLRKTGMRSTARPSRVVRVQVDVKVIE